MDNALQHLVRGLWQVIKWLREQLDDDAMRRTILEQLRLDGSAPAPPPTDPRRIDAIEAYLASDDPDVLAFLVVADSVAEVFDALETFFTPLVSGLGETVTARDVLYLVTQFGTIELMRRDAPLVYASARAVGIIDERIFDHALPRLRPLASPIQALESLWTPLETEEHATARTDPLLLLAFAAELVLLWYLKKKCLDLDYRLLAGWDLPEDPTGLADSIASRTITLALRRGLASGTTAGLTSSWIVIPRDHGGPGLFLSLGGQLEFEESRRGEKLKINLTAPEALSFFLGAERTEIAAGADARLELEYVRGRALGGPALAFPRPTGTRVEIGNFGIGFGADRDEVSARLIFDRSALVLASDDPDSFVASLFPSDGIRVDFDLALGFDFVERQFFLGTSAKLEVVIPIGKPLGPLTVFHVTIRLGAPEGDDETREVTVRLAFSFKLFAITGVVDQIGFRAAFRATETGGRLGLIDQPEFGFVPPKGIGLSVKAVSVRGGGFVFFDPDNDEYTGVLSLEVSGWSIKVIGLIKTNLGTSPDFSLLLIGSVEGLDIALPAGGLLTGIGLVLGMHRTISVEAFQAGIKNRTLDALLFPEDPVANAPQLLQALKALFPTAPDQWIVGLNLQAATAQATASTTELNSVIAPSPMSLTIRP